MALGLCLYWPRLITNRPSREAPKKERARFASVFLAYNGVVVLMVGGATIGSILIMRQTKKELRVLTEANLKELVEGTLNDHRRREREEESPEQLS